MRIRTTFIGATEARGERIKVIGPDGQRTYSYDYGVYDMHDEAVMRYLDDAVSQDDLFALPHPRRRLTRSGKGYSYNIPTPIPADWPVQPLTANESAKDRATCGTCGRSWDDGISTSMTPTPSARCPFEVFHN